MVQRPELPAFRFGARRARSRARLARRGLRVVVVVVAREVDRRVGGGEGRRALGIRRVVHVLPLVFLARAVIVRRESQRGLGDPRRRNRGGRRNNARVREQRVDAARRGVFGVERDVQIERFFTLVPRALIRGQHGHLRDRPRDRRRGQRGVHGRQQEPFLRRAEGPAAETTAAAAAAAARTAAERPRAEQRVREVPRPGPGRSRGSRGPEARVEAPGALEHGLGKHKLAIAIGRDTFAGESARLGRRTGASAERRQRGGVGVGAAPRFRLHDASPAGLDDRLHRAFELGGLEVRRHLHLGEVPHLPAKALEVFAVLRDAPLAHLQHHLHLHGRR